MTSANQHFPKLRSSSALEEQKIPPVDCGGLTETVNPFLSFVKHEVLEEYTISAIHFVAPVTFYFPRKTLLPNTKPWEDHPLQPQRLPPLQAC